MRWLIVLSGLVIGQSAGANDAAARFYKMSPHELCVQFSLGTPCPPEAKAYRGRVVWVDEAKFPRARGYAQSILWRGKEFQADGSFTNRFPGFTALSSRGATTESWTDGGSAFVMDYPAKTPLFGKYRDELRFVAPGVYLGRAWDRTTGKPIGWFVLAEK